MLCGGGAGLLPPDPDPPACPPSETLTFSSPPSSPFAFDPRPRFRLRSNCEFAKEAMANQALTGKETLNVKWAMDDPNPAAQEAVARSNLDAAMVLLQAQGVALQAPAFRCPESYALPPPKKRARGEGGDEGGEDGAESYPDTDGQYEREAGGAREGGEWTAVFDPVHQAYYYVQAGTGKTSWDRPGGGGGGGGVEGGGEGGAPSVEEGRDPLTDSEGNVALGARGGEGRETGGKGREGEDQEGAD